ncbi:MAG: crossover junction endodeoxyribonuclease RuvC [Anaerolineaceae bacterium]|jgi:crossover junction endodeoxyribonuclease RuvC|nr:crossover junction endodeoxyribonuclease RuvC [Anaerolineaceae bacterium]
MIILGIDPGTAITGYGFVEENERGQLCRIAHGVIETPAKMPMEERLLLLHEELTKLILLHHPQSGAVEKLFFRRNVTTAISVGQARGVILLAMVQNGVQVKEYTPMQIKQAVTGWGGAQKPQVQEMVRALLELEEVPKPDDAADALAVAICHSHSRAYNQLLDS